VDFIYFVVHLTELRLQVKVHELFKLLILFHRISRILKFAYLGVDHLTHPPRCFGLYFIDRRLIADEFRFRRYFSDR